MKTSPAIATAIPPTSLAQAQVMLAQLQQQIQTLELKNQKLTHELAYLKRLRFGRKAESLSVEQRSLFEEDLDEDLAAITAELAPEANAPSAHKPRPRAGRQPLPPHLE